MSAGALRHERVLTEDLAAWMQRLAEPGDAAVRRKLCSGHPGCHSVQAMERLHAEILRLAYVDVARAARLAEACGWIADFLNEPGARALSLRSQGHVDFAQGRHASALENYRAALDLLEPLGAELEIGRTLTSGLQALIYLGRYEEAFEWAERSRAIFERQGDVLRLARLDSNVGNILFRQDRYQEALEHYERARPALSRLGEPRDVAAVLSNMAVCSISLGQFSLALNHYQAARDHCVRHGLPLLVSAADYNIAYLHYLRGDYLQAMRMYQLSRRRAEDAGDLYHAALCDLDESEMFLELNLSDEASHLARQAALRFERSGMTYERAKALVTQAIAASHSGELSRALALLRVARVLFVKEQNRAWPAVIDLYRGILRYRQGQYSQAEKLAQQASEVLSRSPMYAKAVYCRLLQARLLRQKGSAGDARALCLDILETLHPDATPALRFHVHVVRAEVEEQLNDPDAAWASYQAARREIEDLRSRLLGDEFKISALKDKLAVYESLVWLSLWRRPKNEDSEQDIFLLMCHAKSRSLAEHIAFPFDAPSRNVNGLNEEMRDARRDLNWCYREIERHAMQGPESPVRIEKLLTQARECEENLSRTLSATRAVPGKTAAAAKLAEPDVKQIRESIPCGAMALEYYEARGALYVAVLNRDQVRVLPLAPSDRVREVLNFLQFQISKFRLGPEYQRAFRVSMLDTTLAHLAELYQHLIAPVRPLLNCQHLIIAPHSFLHGLPFHALHSNGRFLLDEFSVSYTPSASVFALCQARDAKFRNESLVLGVPDASAPQIEDEARYAAAALPNAHLRLGSDATEAVLRQHGPASRFIHIATHGTFRPDKPLFSSIRLGDSHLSLLDLYQIPLAAELVTLSGCSTGLSAVVGGDELLGMLRGVLFAGAQAVLASLWDVHDASTAEFMTAFYGRMPVVENKAQALREAMIDLRRQYPHPYFWAPFILVGKYAS